jgi:hypothetical protein
MSVSRSALAETCEGGVILVGGEKQGNDYLDTLFHLKDAGNGSQWTLMTKKLEKARSFHVAFLTNSCSKIQTDPATTTTSKTTLSTSKQ